MDSNRRRFKRIAVDLPAMVCIADPNLAVVAQSHAYQAQVLDVCMGALLLVGTHRFAIGTYLSLDMSIGGKTVRFYACVRHLFIRPVGSVNPYGHGLQLVGSSRPDFISLMAYLNDLRHDKITKLAEIDPQSI